jgi:Transposase, Mutator family
MGIVSFVVQTCIVHMIRNSMRFVGWAQRKAVCAELRNVYAAPREQAGLAELDAFEAKYAQRYPAIASSWRSNWERVRPFFDFPAELRRLIYTTNAIESLNFQLRKVTKAKGHFPNDEAATKLLYLALRNAEKKWTMVPSRRRRRLPTTKITALRSSDSSTIRSCPSTIRPPSANSKTSPSFASIAGSTEGAHRACVLLGIIATCRALRVPAQAYLVWAFERLGTHREVFDFHSKR